jgi:hypothetical protein
MSSSIRLMFGLTLVHISHTVPSSIFPKMYVCPHYTFRLAEFLSSQALGPTQLVTEMSTRHLSDMKGEYGS